MELVKINTRKINKILRSRLEDETLGEHEVYKVLESIGFNVPQYEFISEIIKDPKNKKVVGGQRTVLKAIIDGMTHKTDSGAVEVGVFPVHYARKINELFEKFKDYEGFRGIMGTELVKHDTNFGGELQIGIKNDPAFGPVLIYGIGGTQADAFLGNPMVKSEVMSMTAIGLLDERVEEQLKELVEKPKLLVKQLPGNRRGDKGEAADTKNIVSGLEKIVDFMKVYSGYNPHATYHVDRLEINPFTTDMRPLDGVLSFHRSENYKTRQRPYENIEKTVDPDTILIAGISAKKGEPNSPEIAFSNLLKGGYNPSNIYFLHPKKDDLREKLEDTYGIEFEEDNFFSSPEEAKASLGNKRIDMLYNGINPKFVPALLKSVVDQKLVHAIYTISAGFGETEAGKEAQKEMEQIINDSDIAHIGPNTVGNYARREDGVEIDTFFAPPLEKSSATKDGYDNLAMVSQSGARAITFRSSLSHIISPKLTVSIGNGMDMKASDFMKWLSEKHSDLDVFAFYLESFGEGDGLEFAKAAREMVKKGKTVILHKAGRSPEAAAATETHTGKAAGAYDITTAVLEQAGVYVTNDPYEFENMTMLFSALPNVGRNRKEEGLPRISGLSNAGYEKCSIADYVLDENNRPVMSIADFEDKTYSGIKEVMKGLGIDFIDLTNPIDLGPLVDDNGYYKIVSHLMEDKGIDGVVASIVPETKLVETLPIGQGENGPEFSDKSLMVQMDKLFQEYKDTKPIVFSMSKGYKHDPAEEYLKRKGVPIFRSPHEATLMMGKYFSHRKLEDKVRG